MEFRILGCLEAEAGGERLRLGGLREQKVLAVLLLDADRMVPVRRLVDALWDDDPPATAFKQAQNAVGRLRRLLAASGGADPVVTGSSGYRFQVGRHTLDARVFDTQVARAEAAASAGKVAEAAALLGSVLDLWRGQPLAGLSGRVIEAAADAWNERRCAVQETYYDHRLALGEHRQLIGDLRALVSAYPLRGRPVTQLMLALYRCGRQADALEVYSSARAVLAAELGLDPDPHLQRLQQQILTRDPGLELPGRLGPGSCLTPGTSLARSTAAAARRAAELRRPRQRAEGTGPAAGRAGAAGWPGGGGYRRHGGHWQDRVRRALGTPGREAVPGWAALRQPAGLRPVRKAAEPAAGAVRGFLTALNVPVERVPASLDEQAALYRSLLAGKKVLIVADNARDSAQVRPLLPGSPRCVVLVTSRRRLTGLVAADGAQPVSLALLTGDEARQLLADRLGADRLAAEPGATDELIRLCARLPLALSVTAARAAGYARRRIAVLAAELREARNRLDALDTGDDVSVRAAFSWSYGELTGRAARLFRLLGLHPGPDISVPAAASLAGVPHDQVAPVLAELAGAHLVDEQLPGRFTCHDLLRSYAAELAREAETESDRHAAVSRLLDHCLHTAHAAALLLHPAREPITLGPRSADAMPEHLSSREDALAWFDVEHRVLLAAVTLASDLDLPVQAWQIAWTLANFLDRRGHWHDWRTAQQTALAAAWKAGDVLGQAHAHSLLGRAEVSFGRHDEAREHLSCALALFQYLDDRAACARAYLDLGWVADQQGRHSDATAPMRRALAMYRSIGHEVGEAHTLSNLGWHYAVRGDHQVAIACCREALMLHRAHGNVVVRAATLDTLGYIHHLLENYPQAIRYYQQAVSELVKLGARLRVARTLRRVADSHAASGNPGAAGDAWEQALTILESLGHPDADDVRSKLGDLRARSGARPPVKHPLRSPQPR